jgi:hypothetical protein
MSESSNNIARFRLCNRHIRDPRGIHPIACVQTICFRAHFQRAVSREPPKEEQAGMAGCPELACYGIMENDEIDEIPAL